MTSTPSPGASTLRKNHDAFGDDFISFDMEDEYDESASPPAPVVVDDSVREHASARSTPWAQHVPWHQCRNVSEMLCEEIRTYTNWIVPSEEEHVTRTMVISLFQRALCSKWPDARVYSFGSQDTQLYLPQGDIDLVVLSNVMNDMPREITLSEMAACLRSYQLAVHVQVLARAKVPIIKFVCPYGQFNVDISINQANGLQASKFVNGWLKKQPAIRPLVMVVKQFLQQRALSEVYTGGLGSYSVTLMVLSFLQLHPKLQRGEMSADKNLGTLLMEFLELYGKNYGYDECAISVRGRGKYLSKRQKGMYDYRKPFMLSIEDPHDPSSDVSRGSFAILSVRSALGGAFDILHAALCERANDLQNFRHRQQTLHNRQQKNTHMHFAPEDADNRLNMTSQIKEPESLLGSVLGVSREMIRRRKDIKQLYDSGILQKQLYGSEAVPQLAASSTLASKLDRRSANASASSSMDDDTSDASVVFLKSNPKRRKPQNDDDQDSSSESKYGSMRPKKRAAQDPWKSRPSLVTSDSDDEHLTSKDAPYVLVSSDSDDAASEPSHPPADPLPRPPTASTPVKSTSTGISIAGRAKRTKLSKQDRLQYWHNKALAPAQTTGNVSP